MSYRDKLYSSYASTHTEYLHGEFTIRDVDKQFPVWHEYFRKFLPLDKESQILDLGCGNGGFVYWLQQLGFDNAYGIDISSEQVATARKLGIKNIFQSESEEFLKDKENVYAVIIARDLQEHFTKNEVLPALSAINRALVHGGQLIIQTPNGESPYNGRMRYGDFTHEFIFTRSSLSQVLKASGFKDCSYYSTGPVPKGLRSTVRYILWKGIVAFHRGYQIIETGSALGIFTQNIIARAKK